MIAPRPLAIAYLAALACPALAQDGARIVSADGRWAVLERAGRCEAVTRSVRKVAEGRAQPRAGFIFDPARKLNGQFFVQLRRPARQGASVILKVEQRPFLLVSRGNWAWSGNADQDRAIIAAIRASGGMRVEAREAGGRRFVDHFELRGAPTAIDAAAAHCARRALAKRPKTN